MDEPVKQFRLLVDAGRRARFATELLLDTLALESLDAVVEGAVRAEVGRGQFARLASGTGGQGLGGRGSLGGIVGSLAGGIGSGAVGGLVLERFDAIAEAFAPAEVGRADQGDQRPEREDADERGRHVRQRMPVARLLGLGRGGWGGGGGGRGGGRRCGGLRRANQDRSVVVGNTLEVGVVLDRDCVGRGLAVVIDVRGRENGTATEHLKELVTVEGTGRTEEVKKLHGHCPCERSPSGHRSVSLVTSALEATNGMSWMPPPEGRHREELLYRRTA